MTAFEFFELLCCTVAIEFVVIFVGIIISVFCCMPIELDKKDKRNLEENKEKIEKLLNKISRKTQKLDDTIIKCRYSEKPIAFCLSNIKAFFISIPRDILNSVELKYKEKLAFVNNTLKGYENYKREKYNEYKLSNDEYNEYRLSNDIREMMNYHTKKIRYDGIDDEDW